MQFVLFPLSFFALPSSPSANSTADSETRHRPQSVAISSGGTHRGRRSAGWRCRARFAVAVTMMPRLLVRLPALFLEAVSTLTTCKWQTNL